MYKKLFLACLSTFIMHAASDYRALAREWLQEYVVEAHICAEDRQHLSDLLYFSYLRSNTSIQMQQFALKLASNSWKAWQNVAQTRMNPALDFPYPMLSQEDVWLMQTCVDLQKEYSSANANYAYMCDLVMEKKVVSSKKLLEGIMKIRDQARVVVSKSLLDLKMYMSVLKHQLHLLKKIGNTKSSAECKKGISDFIMNHLPALGAKSFIEAEKSTLMLSEEGWKVLSAIQDINCYIWHTLETQRAEFYNAYYQELCAIKD